MSQIHPFPISFGWSSLRNADPLDTPTQQELARITRHDRGSWTIQTEQGELVAELRGRLRKSLSTYDIPTVGDWVLVTARRSEGQATIESVLPRTSALVRGAVGRSTDAQIVAANVDYVLIAVPCDSPANPRRLERQLAMTWESGAVPIVVLTKADLPHDSSWVVTVSLGADVVEVDSVSGTGVDQLDQWLLPGKTLVVVGPSGAGKSTLANCLLGEDVLATGDVREGDRRGRHTTTWRELVVLPSGALLIDTPGIRELALWDASDGLSSTFAEVEEIAESCRFTNCKHDTEPGCAITSALTDGSLDHARLAGWKKLQREQLHHEMRHDARLRAEEAKRWAALVKNSGRARP